MEVIYMDNGQCLMDGKKSMGTWMGEHGDMGLGWVKLSGKRSLTDHFKAYEWSMVSFGLFGSYYSLLPLSGFLAF